MDVTVKRREGILLVQVIGRIDGSNAGRLEEAVRNALDENDRGVMLDFERLVYMSSAGMRVVLLIAKIVRRQNIKLALCSMAKQIRDVFEISGFGSFLSIYPSPTEALASLGVDAEQPPQASEAGAQPPSIPAQDSAGAAPEDASPPEPPAPAGSDTPGEQRPPEPGDLSGRVAIVTGAGGGLGRAIALRLASGGARVLVNDLSPMAAQRTLAELEGRGHEAAAMAGDVSAADDIRRVVERARERFGAIHVLVNNAGVLRSSRVADIEEEEWDFVIRVNLKGTYLCSRAVLPAMREQGWGRIVNVSSAAGRSTSTVGGAHYTASKAGVLGFTRHLAREVAGDGITVNAVCPGPIDTDMVRSNISEAQARAYTERIPISRLGEPCEVAELVSFLASDRSAYITGASLDINGGSLML